MSDETYGMPRIRAELADWGVVASRKRIARLMRLAHIQGVSRRRGFCVTTRRDKSQRAAPDLVKRQFVAQDVNQLWVADMTYIPTWAGFLYLAVVTDVYSRKVVGWMFGQRMTADLVIAALNMALLTRKPVSVIHHSDQGSQGGFNRSSQHHQLGGVYGTTSRMDEAIYREGRNALSRGSLASARG
jgi:putative transposase